MHVEIARAVTPALVDAFASLIPQLSKSNPPPTADQLIAIVDSPATEVFVAYGEEGEILGTLTLVVFRIPTGMRAWIEDVVVDAAESGKGVGRALNRAALDRALAMGAVTVDLTSRPSREAANHLYQSLGFEPRETNVWRFEL
jgi:ribosomal protein S18 acetylase RimI-like enzyme